MRKLILFLFMLPLFASGQIVIGDSIIIYGGGSFNGTISLDTTKYSAGGSIYYYASSGDTVFINSDTLLNAEVSGDNIQNQNTIEQTADFWINGNGKANTYDVGSAYKYDGSNVITAQPSLNNYFFGGAGNLSMTGGNNTASGYYALRSNTTGKNNAASGMYALRSNTTGNNNTASGYAALYSNTTGIKNNASGDYALYYNTTGSNNTASGMYALRFNTTGSNNTASGIQSLRSNTTGSNNTTSGYTVLNDLGSAQTSGTFNTGTSYTIKTVGTTDFTLIGAADNNVGTVFTANDKGTGTGTATPNGTNNNTAIGYNTGRGIIFGTGNTILGANVTGLDAGLTNNIILADGSGNQRINVDGSGNTGIGIVAPSEKLDVDGNGKFSGTLEVGGTSVFNDDMTLNGSLDLTGDINAVGELRGAILTSNIADGGQSPLNITSTTLVSNLNADLLDGHHWSDVTNQTPIPDNQLAVGTGNGIEGNSNLTWDGSILDVDGSINIADGSAYKYGGIDVIMAQPSKVNFFFGWSGNLTMTGTGNNALGWQSLRSNTIGEYNTAIGVSALYSNTTGSSNVALGFSASNNNTTGHENTAIGRNALQDNLIGNQNTAVGYNALIASISNNNTAIGTNALGSDSTGHYNTAIGTNAGYFTNTTGIVNKAGDNSVFLGANTKAHADNETNQIVIGFDATGNGSNTVTLGNNSITKTALKGNVTINDTTGSDARSTLDIRGSISVKRDSTFSNNVWVTIKRNSYLPSLATTGGRMFYINNPCIGGTCTTYTLTGDGTDTIILDDATAANTVNLISGFFICYNADNNWIIITVNTY